MVIVLKRISLVLLLSGMLISGQAEATAASRVLPNLSGKMQNLRSQVRKVLENKSTLDISVLSAGVCSVASCFAYMFDPISTPPFLSATAFSTFVMALSSTANTNRLEREAEELEKGLVQIQEFVDKTNQSKSD